MGLLQRLFRKRIIAQAPLSQALVMVGRGTKGVGVYLLPSQFHYDSFDIECEQAIPSEREGLLMMLPSLKKMWRAEDEDYCANGNKPLRASYL